MSNGDITLKDIHNDLRELITWIKFSGIKEVKPVLETQLNDDVKKNIYALSDGKNSSYDIEKKTGTVSQRTISNYWNKWEKAGIVEPYVSSGKGSRFKASFDLKDFGIDVPELQKPNKESTLESNEVEKQTTGSEGNNE